MYLDKSVLIDIHFKGYHVYIRIGRGLIANWLEAKTIIFRYFLARYRNFLPQVDQKVHQVLQNLPQAFCIGDVIRYDSIKPEKTIKSKICKIIIKLYISENLFKK